MTIRPLALAATLAWIALASPLSAQKRPAAAAPQRPDSFRITLLATGMREMVTGDDDAASCDAVHVPKDGTERVSGILYLHVDIAQAGVGPQLKRETNMPVCSYKRSGSTSVYCGMRLTGSETVELNYNEGTDAEHGDYMELSWGRVDTLPVIAHVDPGSCLTTRNEKDAELTGPMADDYRKDYLSGTGFTGDAVFFRRPKRKWTDDPVPLKSLDRRYTLEVTRLK